MISFFLLFSLDEFGFVILFYGFVECDPIICAVEIVEKVTRGFVLAFDLAFHLAL